MDPIYILVTQSDGKQFPVEYEGQTQEQIDAMLPAAYPGSTRQVISKAEYDALRALEAK